jgi:uncharacterized OB-fold protein
MICPTCGRETGPQETDCPFCRDGGGEVKVLTPAERESFRGVTVDSGQAEGDDQRYDGHEEPRQRIYVRHVSFGGGTSLLTKLIILAVIGVVVFVVLPVFFLFFAAAGILWFILSLLRRSQQ